MQRTLIHLLAAAMLFAAGCTTPPKVTPEAQHYAAQADYQKQKLAAQKPLVEFEALEGQSLEIKGLKRFAVYAPKQPGADDAFVPYQAPDGEIVAIVKAAAPIVEKLITVGAPIAGTVALAKVVSDAGVKQTQATADVAKTSVAAIGDTAVKLKTSLTINNTIDHGSTGTIGGGTTTGANSGDQSGNKGTLGNENGSPKTTTETKTSTSNKTVTKTTTTNINCASGGSGPGGDGGTGTGAGSSTNPGGATAGSGNVNCGGK